MLDIFYQICNMCVHVLVSSEHCYQNFLLKAPVMDKMGYHSGTRLWLDLSTNQLSCLVAHYLSLQQFNQILLALLVDEVW